MVYLSSLTQGPFSPYLLNILCWKFPVFIFTFSFLISVRERCTSSECSFTEHSSSGKLQLRFPETAEIARRSRLAIHLAMQASSGMLHSPLTKRAVKVTSQYPSRVLEVRTGAHCPPSTVVSHSRGFGMSIVPVNKHAFAAMVPLGLGQLCCQ